MKRILKFWNYLLSLIGADLIQKHQPMVKVPPLQQRDRLPTLPQFPALTQIPAGMKRTRLHYGMANHEGARAAGLTLRTAKQNEGQWHRATRYAPKSRSGST